MFPFDAIASSVLSVLHGITGQAGFFAIGLHCRSVSFWALDVAAGQDLRTVLLPANFSLM
jgi:hypothetical protein